MFSKCKFLREYRSVCIIIKKWFLQILTLSQLIAVVESKVHWNASDAHEMGSKN